MTFLNSSLIQKQNRADHKMTLPGITGIYPLQGSSKLANVTPTLAAIPEAALKGILKEDGCSSKVLQIL